jgi:ubiquinone/menaquinone biosynthesis C-methylase UbiE
MMENDVKKWLEEGGEKFLRDIGIKKGQFIVDFGCGAGHYTIPAAKIVEKEGTVYAIDKDRSALDQVMRRAKSENLNNIIPLNTSGTVKIDLDDETIDVVLLYDVLHYRDTEERGALYHEVYRILKPGALLSVYPKHHKLDWPLWNLADRTIEDIIKEIEVSYFDFYGKNLKELLIHDDEYTQGQILNFRKTGEKGGKENTEFLLGK